MESVEPNRHGNRLWMLQYLMKPVTGAFFPRYLMCVVSFIFLLCFPSNINLLSVKHSKIFYLFHLSKRINYSVSSFSFFLVHILKIIFFRRFFLFPFYFSSTAITFIFNFSNHSIPMVVGALGAVPKGLANRVEGLEVRGRIETIQTTALIRSTRILIRVLETRGDLLSLNLQYKTNS